MFSPQALLLGYHSEIFRSPPLFEDSMDSARSRQWHAAGFIFIAQSQLYFKDFLLDTFIAGSRRDGIRTAPAPTSAGVITCRNGERPATGGGPCIKLGPATACPHCPFFCWLWGVIFALSSGRQSARVMRNSLGYTRGDWCVCARVRAGVRVH